MVELKGGGLDDFSGQGGYSGSGGSDCPAGQHWDATQNKCVPDVVVGNQPDGHKYEIESSPNESGLVWNLIYEDNNKTDADKDFNEAVKAGGWWRMKIDGVVNKSNWVAPKVEDDSKDIWSIEALVGDGWTWLADASSLAEAEDKVKAIRAGALASIPGSSDLRITDKNGTVISTDKGVAPEPGEEAQSYTDKDGKTHYKWKDGTWHDTLEGETAPGTPSTGSKIDVENSMNAIMVAVVVVMLIGMSAYMLQGAE